MQKSSIFVGFDGFVDSLFHCVAKRISPKKFTPLKKIGDFGSIAKNATDTNASVECVLQLQDVGGNAPLLARALSSLSHKVILAGCCGFPDLHPVFSSLPQKNLMLHSIGAPGFTDALEFSDGKLFLGKMGELGSLDLATVTKRFPSLYSSLQECACIATVNWTMMPLVEEFWNHLLKNRKLLAHTPTLFVDLAHPAKRPSSDLRKSLSLLSKLSRHIPVILGLNKAEAHFVARELGLFSRKSLVSSAAALRKKLSLASILIHTKKECAIVSETDSASCSVPLIASPLRTTGAGDTFNAGFLSALINGGSLLEMLQAGIAASGTFIRTGKPPTSTYYS